MARPFWHRTGRWAVMVRRTDGTRTMVYDASGLAKNQFAKAAAWAERQAADAEGRVRVQGEPTVAELRGAYLSWCARRVDEGEASRHTLDGHRKQLRLVCKAEAGGGRCVGDLHAREFTPRVLERLIEGWGRQGKSPTTIRNRCASALAMYHWASQPRADRERERLIESNPLDGFEPPRGAVGGERFAPAEEVRAFLDFVERQAARAVGKFARFERLTALLVRVVAETGCRPGELCEARWEHYDPEHRAIILPPALHKTGRQTGRKRHIMLGAGLAVRIEEEMRRPERHPTHIFCHRIGSQAKQRDGAPHGIPWNSNALCKRIRALRRDAVAAGVLRDDTGERRMHLYKLRHTAITLAVDAGVPLADVARLSGNSAKTIETTYLSHRPEHLRGVADRLRGEGDDA